MAARGSWDGELATRNGGGLIDAAVKGKRRKNRWHD